MCLGPLNGMFFQLTVEAQQNTVKNTTTEKLSKLTHKQYVCQCTDKFQLINMYSVSVKLDIELIQESV